MRAAIFTEVARLLRERSQIVSGEAMGPFSISYRGSFEGWSVAELAVLNRCRQRAEKPKYSCVGCCLNLHIGRAPVQGYGRVLRAVAVLNVGRVVRSASPAGRRSLDPSGTPPQPRCPTD